MTDLKPTRLTAHPRRGSNICSSCGERMSQEAAWPDDDDGELCQMCWEQYADSQWWKLVESIEEACGL